MLASDRLKRWRQSLGLSKAELARRLRCHDTMISHLEGGRKAPGRGLACRIEALSASWAEGSIAPREWSDDEDAEAAA